MGQGRVWGGGSDRSRLAACPTAGTGIFALGATSFKLAPEDKSAVGGRGTEDSALSHEDTLAAECSAIWSAGRAGRLNQGPLCRGERFGVPELSSTAPLRISIRQGAAPLRRSGTHSWAAKLRS